jgi:penicillin-binding protein 1C
MGAWFLIVRPYPAERLLPRRAASLTFLDAQGTILRQEAVRGGGRESWVALDRISPHLIHAFVAAEDHRFTSHGGVDVLALGRALWLNLRARRLAFGASTLTMQLVRLLEARPRSLSAKLGEMVLAWRLELTLSKRQILEQYLNRVYFGNGAWGAQAAAALYFDKPADGLSPGEAALLAVLPRGPEAYNPYRNLPSALARRSHVLALMGKRHLLAEKERLLAERSPLTLRRQRPGFHAPHFVDHVASRLSSAQREGATVQTTLDGPLQELLEEALRQHLAQVHWLRIGQAALVVLRNSDGAVLAMVGSGDYFDAEHHGAVNGAVARHRPGSTLKPFVYGLALEKGDTPATIAFDVILPQDLGQSYTSEVRQHGFARYREALAGSYNLAAVHTLARVGIPALVSRLRRAGLHTLDWPDSRYRLDLAIGETEVRLLDLTAAFATFAREGLELRPRPIAAVRLPGEKPIPSTSTAPARLFSPQVAYLIYHMLQDPDARRPMFGDHVPLYLPFPVALKTGTTRAYTDNWALGTTREFTVGVWAGNFSGEPTAGVMSMRGATPLLRAAFVALAARFGNPTAPPRPEGLSEGIVCPVSGQLPGPLCSQNKHELFLSGGLPREYCTWHRLVCGQRITQYPPQLQGWAAVHGLLHRATCAETASDNTLRILSPTDGAQFVLDPFRPASHQVPPLRAAPASADVRWIIDGLPAETWRPTPGEHRVRAELDGTTDEISIRFF